MIQQWSIHLSLLSQLPLYTCHCCHTCLYTPVSAVRTDYNTCHCCHTYLYTPVIAVTPVSIHLSLLSHLSLYTCNCCHTCFYTPVTAATPVSIHLSLLSHLPQLSHLSLLLQQFFHCWYYSYETPNCVNHGDNGENQKTIAYKTTPTFEILFLR